MGCQSTKNDKSIPKGMKAYWRSVESTSDMIADDLFCQAMTISKMKRQQWNMIAACWDDDKN